MTSVLLPPSRPEEPPTWSGYMGKMFMAATNYLPAQVSGMMSQDRAFATVRLNFSGQRNICVLSTYVRASACSCPSGLQRAPCTHSFCFLIQHLHCCGPAEKGAASPGAGLPSPNLSMWCLWVEVQTRPCPPHWHVGLVNAQTCTSLINPKQRPMCIRQLQKASHYTGVLQASSS